MTAGHGPRTIILPILAGSVALVAIGVGPGGTIYMNPGNDRVRKFVFTR